MNLPSPVSKAGSSLRKREVPMTAVEASSVMVTDGLRCVAAQARTDLTMLW